MNGSRSEFFEGPAVNISLSCYLVGHMESYPRDPHYCVSGCLDTKTTFLLDLLSLICQGIKRRTGRYPAGHSCAPGFSCNLLFPF